MIVKRKGQHFFIIICLEGQAVCRTTKGTAKVLLVHATFHRAVLLA